ncbi:hypothetical protein B9G54_02340 [Alloscardovia macacae]|uniref:Arylsulfotransferase N-terminal domain-containing protein n=1 Tax=Alloscardovia macacae TaxID=1160091 RepID=A0A1Y2SZ73_9BIFI|nr:aryl-sulfate sulfotransferase [Alloscardovia macacae]OTA27099.1 hypothetical protein B9G54_02340 [Alloscardovia macacae]OTA29709.1 hypothetical protein B9T39_02415 [Alloscardovia macacae]
MNAQDEKDTHVASDSQDSATPRVYHSSGTRTRADQWRDVSSPRLGTMGRNAKGLADSGFPPASSHVPLRNRLVNASLSIAVVLVVALTVWGGLTYYTARRNAPENVLTQTVDRVYTIGYQTRALNRIERAKNATRHTIDNMLIEANPFGTNTLALYVYFVTNEPASVSYTVNAPETSYPTFTRTVSTHAQRMSTHEFQVVGLIPATRNVVTFSITDANGQTTTREYTYTMGDTLSDAPVRVRVDDLHNAGDSVGLGELNLDGENGSSNGLFAVMPATRTNSSTNFAYMYDTNGVLRSEIPLKNITATRFLERRGWLYYAISPNQLAVVAPSGHVESFLNFDGRYTLNAQQPDYTMDSSGNILAIATNGDTFDSTREVGTYVVRINALNGKMRVMADMASLMSSYRSTTTRAAVAMPAAGSSGSGSGSGSGGSSALSLTRTTSSWDWLGLNSIALIDDTHILLSSRETSSLLTLDVSTGDSPVITAIIGPAPLWNDTQYYADYGPLLLTKDGTFPDAAGQSDLHISDVTADGYTVSFFNNNFAFSPTRPFFNWSTAIPSASQRAQNAGEFARSYIYTYRVNTTERTFTLTSSQAVEYSPLFSNIQFFSSTFLTSQTTSGSWDIWTEGGTRVSRFNAGELAAFRPLYRVQYVHYPLVR